MRARWTTAPATHARHRATNPHQLCPTSNLFGAHIHQNCGINFDFKSNAYRIKLFLEVNVEDFIALDLKDVSRWSRA